MKQSFMTHGNNPYGSDDSKSVKYPPPIGKAGGQSSGANRRTTFYRRQAPRTDRNGRP